MVVAVVGSEGDGAFALADAVVPVFDHEVGAAQEGGGLGFVLRGDGLRGLLLQGGDGFIDAAGDQEFFGGLGGRVGGEGEGKQQCGEDCRKNRGLQNGYTTIG